MDISHLAVIRSSVSSFIKSCGERYSQNGCILLDIAPQDHEGARPYFSKEVLIETFDINPVAGCTYTGDICITNKAIPSERFDFIVCTEVLEHTVQPFNAVREMFRLCKPGGYLFLTVPFNFRIHGPLPDCWRFTEHGLREVIKPFTILELKSIETPGRDLMPIHYTVIAQK